MPATLTAATAGLAKVRAVTDRLPRARPLRSDARDNRDLILDAARAAFAAEGLNVPMREIARRAGVGQATLYRRFPTKQTLVTEARRAKEAGRLRPDFVHDDLILMLMANGGIRATSTAARVAASRRFAALAIQSFQASPAASSLPPSAQSIGWKRALADRKS
jgi:hypothetical protein